MCGLDRDREELDAEAGGEQARVLAAVVAGEAAGHGDAGDVRGAEGIDGDGGHDAGVDAAREPDVGAPEAGLGEVVAGSEHERLPDLSLAGEGRGLGARRFWRRAQVDLDAEVDLLDIREGTIVAQLGAAAGVVEAVLGRLVEVDIDDDELVAELGPASDDVAAGVDDHRAAVEHELVLTADGVDVGDGDTVVDGAGGEHARAVGAAAAVVGRGADVDAELSAAAGHAGEGLARIPDVLADADAEGEVAGAVDGYAAPGREVALLVEDAVVGEAALVAGVDLAAAGEDGGGVVGVAVAPVDEPHHSDDAGGRGGEGSGGAARLLAEGAAQEQVLGGIAGDGELGEGDDGAASLTGGGDGGADAVAVAVDVADGGVELREGDAAGPHRLSIAEAGQLLRSRRLSPYRPSAVTIRKLRTQARPEARCR